MSANKWLIQNRAISVRILGTNWVQTIVILLLKKLSLTHLKIRLPTNNSLTNQKNYHLTVSKQMSSGLFKNVIYKQCLQCVCVCIYKTWHQIKYDGWYAIKSNPPQLNRTRSANLIIRNQFPAVWIDSRAFQFALTIVSAALCFEVNLNPFSNHIILIRYSFVNESG